MSWRVVVIHNTAKLDLKLNYLVVRSEMNTTKIHISEIAVLLIESTSVSLTAGLLAELTRQKVKVIFCDAQRNPSSELVSYYGSHDTSNKIRSQIQWQSSTKEAVWTEIVREKIRQQRQFLSERGKKKKQSYYQNTFRRFNGMMKQTERDMLQKYILMHCLEWIFQEAKTITSMQP